MGFHILLMTTVVRYSANLENTFTSEMRFAALHSNGYGRSPRPLSHGSVIMLFEVARNHNKEDQTSLINFGIMNTIGWQKT